MQPQPNNTDAVLSNNSSISTVAVLGGIDRVKEQLVFSNSYQRHQALIDTVQYGNKEKALIVKTLVHPDHVRFFIDAVNAGFFLHLGKQGFHGKGQQLRLIINQICNV